MKNPEKRLKRLICLEAVSAPRSKRLEAFIVDKRRPGFHPLKWFGVIIWKRHKDLDWELVRVWMEACLKSAEPYLNAYREEALRQEKGLPPQS